jgi:predicted nucleotidyltransferase
MGANCIDEPIAAALFSKTRRAVLSLLVTHADEAYYLRQLTRAASVGQGAVQRELARLSRAGIITRTVRGRQVYYQANKDSPVFEDLRSLVVKTAGVVDVLRTALAPILDRIRAAFVFGSVAGGGDGRASDVDLLVVGEVSFSDVVSALAPAQERLEREVNPVVYAPGEFREKASSGHHFLTRVLRQAKVFVVGDERELEKLVGKRLAG